MLYSKLFPKEKSLGSIPTLYNVLRFLFRNLISVLTY
nr:MAG TPA: hypothetical protein [Caudoviricetes sp.]DAO46181.1 MAG TPA: hypothetical protein [Bacteriophage sp.]